MGALFFAKVPDGPQTYS